MNTIDPDIFILILNLLYIRSFWKKIFLPDISSLVGIILFDHARFFMLNRIIAFGFNYSRDLDSGVNKKSTLKQLDYLGEGALSVSFFINLVQVLHQRVLYNLFPGMSKIIHTTTPSLHNYDSSVFYFTTK